MQLSLHINRMQKGVLLDNKEYLKRRVNNQLIKMGWGQLIHHDYSMLIYSFLRGR